MPRVFVILLKSIYTANIHVCSDGMERISEIRYSKISGVRKFTQGTQRAIVRVELSVCSEELIQKLGTLVF